MSPNKRMKLVDFFSGTLYILGIFFKQYLWGDETVSIHSPRNQQICSSGDQQKLSGENLKVVWAEFSTLRQF